MKIKNHKQFLTLLFFFSNLYLSAFGQCNEFGSPLPSSGTPTSPYFDLTSTITLTGNLTLNSGDVDIAPGINIIVPYPWTLTLNNTYLHRIRPANCI